MSNTITNVLVIGLIVGVAWLAIGAPTSVPELQQDIANIKQQFSQGAQGQDQSGQQGQGAGGDQDAAAMTPTPSPGADMGAEGGGGDMGAAAPPPPAAPDMGGGMGGGMMGAGGMGGGGDADAGGGAGAQPPASQTPPLEDGVQAAADSLKKQVQDNTGNAPNSPDMGAAGGGPAPNTAAAPPVQAPKLDHPHNAIPSKHTPMNPIHPLLNPNHPVNQDPSHPLHPANNPHHPFHHATFQHTHPLDHHQFHHATFQHLMAQKKKRPTVIHHAPHAVARTHAHSGEHYKGTPGFYTRHGHHHCVRGTRDCICTDPHKCGRPFGHL